MNYLLDTNAVIALLKNQPRGVRNRLRRVVSRGVSIAVSRSCCTSSGMVLRAANAVVRMPSDCACSCRAILMLLHSMKRMPWLPVNCAQRWKRQERRLVL